ncbi:hypothetical protein BDV96DRAFT_658871 [Lophiotrema nucula]|uniref:Uncharacterized protein n=1 Tax=Lophiotrema nucula TaxID=690887 RepID=A0A6A5Z8J9_9PLEO|nr:hypothetical protein BDV96DRAFT_658871 [Lophiotrema nucula]
MPIYSKSVYSDKRFLNDTGLSSDVTLDPDAGPSGSSTPSYRTQGTHIWHHRGHWRRAVHIPADNPLIKALLEAAESSLCPDKPNVNTVQGRPSQLDLNSLPALDNHLQHEELELNTIHRLPETAQRGASGDSSEYVRPVSFASVMTPEQYPQGRLREVRSSYFSPEQRSHLAVRNQTSIREVIDESASQTKLLILTDDAVTTRSSGPSVVSMPNFVPIQIGSIEDSGVDQVLRFVGSDGVVPGKLIDPLVDDLEPRTQVFSVELHPLLQIADRMLWSVKSTVKSKTRAPVLEVIGKLHEKTGDLIKRYGQREPGAVYHTEGTKGQATELRCEQRTLSFSRLSLAPTCLFRNLIGHYMDMLPALRLRTHRNRSSWEPKIPNIFKVTPLPPLERPVDVVLPCGCWHSKVLHKIFGAVPDDHPHHRQTLGPMSTSSSSLPTPEGDAGASLLRSHDTFPNFHEPHCFQYYLPLISDSQNDFYTEQDWVAFDMLSPALTQFSSEDEFVRSVAEIQELPVIRDQDFQYYPNSAWSASTGDGEGDALIEKKLKKKRAKLVKKKAWEEFRIEKTVRRWLGRMKLAI